MPCFFLAVRLRVLVHVYDFVLYCSAAPMDGIDPLSLGGDHKATIICLIGPRMAFCQKKKSRFHPLSHKPNLQQVCSHSTIRSTYSCTPLPPGLDRQDLSAETVATSRFYDVNLGIRVRKAACPGVDLARTETLRTTPSRRAWR